MHTASIQIEELLIPVTSTTPVAGFAELYERHYEASSAPPCASTVASGRPPRTCCRRASCASSPVRPVCETSRTLRSRPAYFRRGRRQRAARRRAAPPGAACGVGVRRAGAARCVQPPFLLKEQLSAPIAAVDRDDASLSCCVTSRGLSDRRAGRDVPDRKNNARQAPPDPAPGWQAEMER